jgi:hypothetical protein
VFGIGNVALEDQLGQLNVIPKALPVGGESHALVWKIKLPHDEKVADSHRKPV